MANGPISSFSWLSHTPLCVCTASYLSALTLTSPSSYSHVSKLVYICYFSIQASASGSCHHAGVTSFPFPSSVRVEGPPQHPPATPVPPLGSWGCSHAPTCLPPLLRGRPHLSCAACPLLASSMSAALSSLLTLPEQPRAGLSRCLSQLLPDPLCWLSAGLTIPEAMPLANLTFCCQGNGSCRMEEVPSEAAGPCSAAGPGPVALRDPCRPSLPVPSPTPHGPLEARRRVSLTDRCGSTAAVTQGPH